MSTRQWEAYGDADEVSSDALGLIPRDNRNHRKKQRLIEERMAAAPGERLLEVGCGGGLHAREWGRDYDLTAVDLSPSLCATCRDRAPGATVIQADGTRLPFPENHFQSVVGAAILHHLESQQTALLEWMRVADESVTLMEPNYLFPKDFLSAHLFAEERHKRQMAPWRLCETLDAVASDYEIKPYIHTPPWPEAAHGLWDSIDNLLRRIPGVRWTSMMFLIHIDLK